jgi:FlaA1/EpsC-like NDP-sugar epimerase
MFKDSRILITGGTGTWGQEFTRQLLKRNIKEIVIFSRNESAQVLMKHKFNDPRLSFIIGDIRDAKAIYEACEDIDFVFHTAALKHVIKCEEQPREAVKTNIYGTQNVIEACIENQVRVCVNISTDKVCYPTCFYGKSKAVAEGLITEANNLSDLTDFLSIRSGNIFGSSGSVVPLWIEQIREKNFISVTGSKMRRFFITVSDAVKATFMAMEMSDRGEVFVPKMDSFYISDLAAVLVESYGNDKTEIRTADAFPYERNTEWLITPEESQRAISNKYFYVIYPLINIKTTDYPPIKEKIQNGFTMTDAVEPDLDKLRRLIKKAGY